MATESWTPARIFLVVSAIYHLFLGVLGLAVDQTFPIGADEAATAGSENILGAFETNGWHSLAAVFIGVVSLYFAIRPARAREAAFGVGISQLGVVAAFSVADPSIFWFASNGADQVIHLTTAIGGIASALATRPSANRSELVAGV
jgi:Domain of unknown function (DUF4383)